MTNTKMTQRIAINYVMDNCELPEDVKENLSEEEIKARDIRRIAECMVFVESWLDEAPQP